MGSMGNLSKRLSMMSASATLAMSQKARSLRAQGRDILSLAAGEPDFDTPEHIRKAAIAAIEAGKTRYTPVDGIAELKQAVRDKFKRENALEYDQDEIGIAPGGKAILYNALMASLDPGDEVVIPTPCWVSYPEMVKVCGGVPVLLACSAQSGYKLTAKALRAALTPKTKWVVVNTPGNPTGCVYSKAELQALADIVREHDRLIVLCDEIYEHIVYEGQHESFAAVAPDLKPRILTMNGVSKAYAMTGWRIGYAGGPKWLIRGMAKLMGQSTGNACSVAQWAAVAALQGPQDGVFRRAELYRKRRDLLCSEMSGIEGLKPILPHGSFYLFADCMRLIGQTTPEGHRLASDRDVADWLLEVAGVACIPGSAFHAPGYLRFSFATQRQILRRACDRIAHHLVRLK